MSFMHCSPTYPAIETPHVYTAIPNAHSNRTLCLSVSLDSQSVNRYAADRLDP